MSEKSIATIPHDLTKQGLTLIEVLLCVALLLLLAAFLIPAVTGPPPGHGHGRTRMLAKGRAIFQSVFAASLEDPSVSPDVFWPSDDLSSTAYFRRQMQNGALSEDFSLFSAPGVPAATRLAAFSAENNAWSVVSGSHMKQSAAQDPFLISRNLNETALIDWAGDERMALQNIGSRSSRSEYTTPYGDEFLVVVRMGGGGEVIPRSAQRWHILNPNSLAHPILTPSHPSEQTAPGSDW